MSSCSVFIQHNTYVFVLIKTFKLYFGNIVMIASLYTLYHPSAHIA